MPVPSDLVYQQVYDLIASYAKRLTSSPEQAHEVTQEAFLKVHRSLPTLQLEEKLTAWVRRIVYTTLMKQYRDQQKWRSLDDLDFPVDADTPAEGNAVVIRCLELLLQVLPLAQRTLLEAVELRGLSQTQYALDHQLALSTVKSRVQRAKRKLKQQLKSNCFLTNDPYGNVVDMVPPSRLT